MRKIFSGGLLCSIVILLFVTCKKEYSPAGLTAAPALIREAKEYFAGQVEHAGNSVPGNYRAGIGKEVLWDRAELVDLSFGKAVIVPVRYVQPLFMKSNLGGGRLLSLDDQTRLFVYRDRKEVWHADLVTAFPDSLCLSHLSRSGAGFSGLRFVEDWNGNGIAKYMYTPGQAVRKYVPGGIKQSSVETSTYTVIETCYTYSGYNYAAGDEDSGEYWEEDGGCSETYVEEDHGGGSGATGGDYGGGTSGGGGGGGGSSIGSSALIIMSPHNLIADTRAYFQCFNTTSGSVYKVTLCVNQPYPGERTPWAFSPYNASSGYSNLVDAGHCFLIFSQQEGSTVITRNIGFYPDSRVWPYNTSAQGVLNDDEAHTYNISGSFSVSSASFFKMVAFACKGNISGYMYDLNNNNCTTFAINTFAAGGINLPNTIGDWPGGSGNDPGDMGEDLRSATISSMTKSNDELSHPNTGTCN